MASTGNTTAPALGPSASVVDGILKQNEKVSTKTAEEMNALGKDAFLKLLVCQMENQDPLQPTNDTEWVSQLATYSQLEQMQNMNQGMTNSQAMGLVGRDVLLNTTDSEGEPKSVSGTVDYVTLKGGKAFLSVGGELYPMEDLVSVIDFEYLVKNCIPKVEASTATFDKADPKDVTFKVNMGSDMGEATAVAIVINEEVIPAEYVKLDKDGTVTISAKAFEKLEEGSYTPTIVFNDNFNTMSNGDFLLTITNSAETGDGTGDAGDGAGNEGGTGSVEGGGSDTEQK